MVGLTTGKVQISAMEADSLGEHCPLRSIQDEYPEQVRNSCKSDKQQMGKEPKEPEQSIHREKTSRAKKKQISIRCSVSQSIKEIEIKTPSRCHRTNTCQNGKTGKSDDIKLSYAREEAGTQEP